MSKQTLPDATSALDQLAQEQHARSVADVQELRLDVWDSDEELEEFLSDWRASRETSLS